MVCYCFFCIVTTPGELFPGYRRHLSPTLYTTVNNPTKNNYLEGLSAGVIDGLIDTAIATKDLISSVARYTGSGLMKLIGQALPPNPGQVGLHASQYFDQINAQLGEIGSGLWDFLRLYYTDSKFQSEFDRQLIGQVKDYFTRLGGMTGDQGYAQGRLIFDIALFLQATGGLKGLISQWKRTKTFKIKDYLPQKPAPKALGSGKTLDAAPGVQNIKELKPASQINATVKSKSVQQTIDQQNYHRYITRKEKAGQQPRNFDQWKEQSEFWKKESSMARGNRFDKKAKDEKWYKFHQVHLSNGKRLDSYSFGLGIISRKSTDLSKISRRTFESYLKEFRQKYDVGTIIRSNKYREIDGTPLKGKFYLEIPDYNKTLPNIGEYIKLARKYDVEIIFKIE